MATVRRTSHTASAHEYAIAACAAAAAGVGIVVAERLALAAGGLILGGCAAAWLVARSRWRIDAILLAALLACLVAGGREFTQIQFGPAFVTEVLLAFIAMWVLLAAFLRGHVDRTVAQRRAMLWLGGLLLAGCIGVAYGVGRGADPYYVARDSVIVGYAAVAVMVAELFRGRSGAERLLRVLYWAGALATIGGVAYVAGARSLGVIAPALGLQMAFFSLPVIARYTRRQPTHAVEWLLVACQVGVLVATRSRTSWVAAAAALVILLLTASRRYAIGMTAIALTVAAVGTALVAPGLLRPVGDKVASFNPANALNESASANASWRLEFWRQDLAYVARHPLVGAGLGPPANFCYRLTGQCWDTRRSRDRAETSGPHNSFVNLAFRLGLPGLIAALGLIATAVWAGRRRRDAAGRTAMALLTFGIVTACFSVALEGPFMGVPFWAIVGVLLTGSRG